jgi:hypothetical protein
VVLEGYPALIVVWALLLGPLPAWVLVWRRLALSGEIVPPKTSIPIILAAVGTGSYVLLWSSILFRPILGADYSIGRELAIIVNGIIVIAVGIIAAFRKHPARVCLIGASTLTMLSWLYVLAVGETV